GPGPVRTPPRCHRVRTGHAGTRNRTCRIRKERIMPTPAPMDDYLFDLRGYLIFRNAVDAGHIADLNAALDTVPPLEYGAWWGNGAHKDDNGAAGMELQNIVEAGEPFERLIDHPAWIDHLRRYCGEQGSYVEGLFIDECFASLRRTGGFFGAHSGGWQGA